MLLQDASSCLQYNLDTSYVQNHVKSSSAHTLLSSITISDTLSSSSSDKEGACEAQDEQKTDGIYEATMHRLKHTTRGGSS